MTTRIYLPCIVFFAAVLVLSNSAQAQLQSATLGDASAEKYLTGLIEFPETHGDASVQLQCTSIIKSNGKMKDAGCFIKNNWDPDFVAAVEAASKKARLLPAQVDGKTETVVLLFQVIFLKTETEQSIHILLNPGMPEMVAEYGEDHISAQRVFGNERWESACPKHAKWLVYTESHVDENGKASSVDTSHRSGIVPTAPCQQALVETITVSRFLPAMADGMAVPSVYVEPFGN